MRLPSLASCRSLRRIAPLLACLTFVPTLPALAGDAPPRRPERAPSFAAELRQARSRLRERLAELDARMTRASGQAEQVAIAGEVERVKASARAELLETQARYARRAGRTRAALALETAATALRASLALPAGPAAPVDTGSRPR